MHWFESLAWHTIVDFATLALAAAAIYLAIRARRDDVLARKIEMFQKLFDMQAQESPRLRANLRAAGAVLHEEDMARGALTEDMIVDRQWRWSGQALLPLADVGLTLLGPTSPHSFAGVAASMRKVGLLPRPGLGLAGNVLLYTGNRPYDDPSYGLASMPQIRLSEGRAHLTLRLGSYFEFIDSCVCFGYEAADAAVSARRRPYPLRRKYSLFDFSNRHAQIGVVTFVVLANVESNGLLGTYALLHKRSARVADSANLLNAVPGATFQPARDDRGTGIAMPENSLLETVVREYCEEVYDLEEFADLTSGDLVRLRPEWPIFRDNTYYLSMGINPLNPYVEILTVTVLDLKRQEHADLFGGRTIEGVQQAIHANDEGGITVRPMSLRTLRHWRHQYEAAPALRQIVGVIVDNIDEFRRQTGIRVDE